MSSPRTETPGPLADITAGAVLLRHAADEGDNGFGYARYARWVANLLDAVVEEHDDAEAGHHPCACPAVAAARGVVRVVDDHRGPR